MASKPSPSTKRQAPAAKRPVRKPTAKRAVDNSPPAETGLVDQVRALAGRLLDISSATVLAGGAFKTAGKASRALRDGHPFDAAGVLVQAVLPGVVEPATWSKTGAAIRTLRESAGLTIAEVGAAIDLDDPSLIEALENGRIAGAAVDVYENESGLFFTNRSDLSIDDRMAQWDRNMARLSNLPNTIVSPHVAFLTSEALNNIAQTTLDNLEHAFIDDGSKSNTMVF